MKSLQEWYRYLEEQARRAAAVRDPADGGDAPARDRPHARRQAAPADPGAGARVPASAAPPDQAPDGAVPGLRARARTVSVIRQERLAITLPAIPPPRRRGGRRPLTESREEIIRRLLDPELSLHEAAAILNVSKATIRRYTGSGKLACIRTAGGQRRFRLSDLLAFLERSEAASLRTGA